ncbi:MAG: DUF3996 domain-containing protein [Desulfuromonadaceae bacterium]|nr:DUF3996 domain-containing protein [Desulfuromonadaceae bacterium]MDD2849327.1 DUF3996 domain-containing protein [Desulfuromonadaceae bacterium]MDD4129386.1 DUF3996 domain-containing protein [Desulfuromonadaceae bacterium]
MKARITGVVMAAFLAVASVATAQDGIGVGVILGEPTGISIKKWISKDQAIDAAAAWSFSDNDSFQLHADYLIHNFGVLNTGSLGGKLPLYYGIGGRIKFENSDNRSGHDHNDTLLGVRVPFGISYLFAKAPVDLFAEIVPVLDIAPDTDFHINGAIGARFYFR